MKYQIETPENVALEVELAGPGTRMMAYLIDFMIIAMVLGALVSIFYASLFSNYWDDDRSYVMMAILLGIIIILYPLSGYFILCESLMRGQTPGKAVAGIRVIREDGRPVGIQQNLIRNWFRLVDCMAPGMYAIGGLTITFSERYQRPGDMAAGTLVIREQKLKTSAQFRWKKPTRVEKIAGMPDLSREEFDLILRYADRGFKAPADARYRMGTRLAKTLAQKYNLLDHPDFHAYVTRMQQLAGKMEALEPAEAILKKMIRYYLTAGEKGQQA